MASPSRNSKVAFGRPPTASAGPSTRPTSRRTSSRCCSTSGSATPGTTSTPAAVADFGATTSTPEIEADYHRFQLPDGCHWGDLRRVHENVGVALQNILDRIQQANPDTLAGIFGDVALGQQGQAARARRCSTSSRRSTRLDLQPVAGRPRRPRQRLRVPAQAVRRRVGQEGRRVLHPARGRPAARPASSTPSRPTRSTTRPAARAACSSRPPTRCIEAGGSRRARCASTARRSTSPPPPSPG